MTPLCVFLYAGQVALLFFVLACGAGNQAQGALVLTTLAVIDVALVTGILYRDPKPPRHNDDEGGDTT